MFFGKYPTLYIPEIGLGNGVIDGLENGHDRRLERHNNDHLLAHGGGDLKSHGRLVVLKSRRGK